MSGVRQTGARFVGVRVACAVAFAFLLAVFACAGVGSAQGESRDVNWNFTYASDNDEGANADAESDSSESNSWLGASKSLELAVNSDGDDSNATNAEIAEDDVADTSFLDEDEAAIDSKDAESAELESEDTESAEQGSSDSDSEDTDTEYVDQRVLLRIDGAIDETELCDLLHDEGIDATDVGLVSKLLEGNDVIVAVDYEQEEDPLEVSALLQDCDFVEEAAPDVFAELCDYDDSEREEGSEEFSVADDVTVDDSVADETSAEESEEDLEYSEDAAAELQTTSVNDPDYIKQWGLKAVNASAAWDDTRVQGAVTVAVVDSGVDIDHPDLVANLDLADAFSVSNKNINTKTNSVDDGVIGHGTHVAGIVAARANNKTGIAGVSYNATILPVKVTYNEKSAYDYDLRVSDIIKALNHLVEMKQSKDASEAVKNLSVVNLSLGIKDEVVGFEDAIEAVQDAGILVVAAAGNNPTSADTAYYPASYEGVLGISNLKSPHTFNEESSKHGSWVDLSAPGTYIYSTCNNPTYTYKNGTSMAAPLVSGIAALVFATNEELSASDVSAILTSTATDYGDDGWDERYGWGMVNAEAAVEAALRDPLSAATVTVADQTYTGSALKPAVTVTYNGKKLVEGTDYTLSYANNTLPGKATVTVKACAKSGYSGSASTTFTITAPLSVATFDELPSCAYTGKKRTPEVTATLKNTSLREGTDFTVKYTKNREIGTACATVTGRGYYTGTVKLSFEIYLGSSQRLSGDTRYDTMLSIVKAEQSATEGNPVVLATGENFPDALAASGLAGLVGGSVVLTEADSLSAQARTALEELNPSEVYLVGGTSALSSAVERSVRSLVGSAHVTRIAGQVRSETAVEIYRAGCDASSDTSWGNTCIVATGAGFADALAISPLSYAHKYPIFLTESNGLLSAQTLKTIRAAGFKRVIIVGGTAVVKQQTASQLRGLGCSVTRLGGATRYETAQAIVNYELTREGLACTRMAVATGENFPDALAGSCLCGSTESVLCLVDGTTGDISLIQGVIREHTSGMERLYLLGGSAALSQETKQRIDALL